jgi:3-hydroxyacyl-[acyl-carrier-protein] dehydratase
MSEPWYSISDLESVSQDSISAKAVAHSDSPWFSGHFPGEPILPGIAELSMVYDLVKKKFAENAKNFRITSLKKIRFKFIVKPEEILDILISSVDNLNNTYSFKLLKDKNIACTGIITIEKTN